MKYLAKLSFIALLVALLGVSMFPAKGSAAFNANNLMDDSVFNNFYTMNAAQIDAFLNSFPSSCISTNNGFTSPDVVGYNPSQGFLYGPNVSAGTVINNAARAYDLNPQVLLATLQKEQSLVSGSAGCHYETPPTQNPCPNPPYGTHTSCVVACQYPGGCTYIAVGYDCPQYCVPGSTGFSKQIIKAAWKLKFVQQRSLGNYNWNVQKPGWDNSDDPQTPYNGYMTQGLLKRSASSDPANYDGYRPVNNNSLSVHLDSGATAALYSYTPFTSGNQNFVSIFENWFGSIIGSDIVRTAGNSTIYLLSGSNKHPISDPNVWADFSVLGSLKFVSDEFINAYTTGPILGHMVGDDNGTLYFVDASIKLPFTSCGSVTEYGYSCGTVITLANYQLAKLASGPNITSVYKTTSGKTFYISGGEKREAFDQQSLTSAGISAAPNVLLEGGISYLPYGNPVMRDAVVVTDRSTNKQYYYESNRFVQLTSDLGALSVFTSLGHGSMDSASIPVAQRYTGFTGFMTNSGATANYVLTTSGKAAITSPNTWSASYTQFSDSFLGSIANDSTPINNVVVKSANDATIYYVVGQKKRPIPSWQDLLNLDVTPFTINVVPATTLNSITTGALMYAPGRLVKAANSSTIYVVQDATHLWPISSFTFPQELGLSLSNLPISDSDLSTYTIQPQLRTKVVCGGTYYIGNMGQTFSLSSGEMTQYGFNSADFADVTAACLNAPISQQSLGDFIRVANGTIYMVQSGQKQAFTNYQAYLNHGGTSQNTTPVSDYFASQIASGSNISN